MLLKQSAAFVRVFKLPTAGLTVNIQLSKAGAALADPNAGASTLTELGRGLYKFSLATQDTNTIGSLGYALTDDATNLTIYDTGDDTDQVGAPDVTLADGVSHGGTTGSSTATLSLDRLSVVRGSAGYAVRFSGNGAPGFDVLVSDGDSPAVQLSGHGNGAGMAIYAAGTAPALLVAGDAGVALSIEAYASSALNIVNVAGHAVNILATGTNKHGILVQGGDDGVCDAIKLVAGTGGVALALSDPVLANIVKVNSVTVSGAGTTISPWGPV